MSPIRPPATRSAPHRWPRPSPRRRRNARPPANAPRPQRLPSRKRGANHSRCTASTPCWAISPPSPAMSSASGAIASPPSSPPPPVHSTAPSICSASPPSCRQTDTAPANVINGLYSQAGKVRSKAAIYDTGDPTRRGEQEPAPFDGWVALRVSQVEKAVILDKQQAVDDQRRD